MDETQIEYPPWPIGSARGEILKSARGSAAPDDTDHLTPADSELVGWVYTTSQQSGEQTVLES